ncbi:MAG: hypothetical protein GY769_08245 [bacterium]|nr:hypothetical protein [bacterium]
MRPRTCFRHRRSWQRWFFVLALCALARPGASSAQPWSGGSTLGVQIRGAGGPIEGAVVEVRHRRPGLTTGPEARRTDSRGQANFVGLIDGRWSLEIKHPEYLSFVASIDVQRGKKPEIVTQFLEATGPGRGTFRVKFLRSDQPFGEVIPGTAIAETEAQPEPERPVSMPAPPTDPATPADPASEGTPDSGRVESRAVPSTVVTPAPQPPASPSEVPTEKQPPAAEPEPDTRTLTAEVPTPLESQAEKPAPAPEAPLPVEVPAPDETPPRAEAAPTPTGAAEPPAVARVEAEDEALAPAPPPPVEAPASAPEVSIAPVSPPEFVAEPTPVVETVVPETSEPDEMAPPAPARLPIPAGAPGSIRAYRDRTCFECKPGEWAVTTELAVTGGEACRATAAVAVRKAMSDVAAAASDQLASFTGPMPLALQQLPLAAATTAARNTLAPYLEPTVSCRFLAVVLPQGGRFTGFRFEAFEGEAGGDCTGEQECEIGQARFLFSPGIARGTGASIVYSLFQNTGGAVRTARLTAFFLPAAGWSPE